MQARDARRILRRCEVERQLRHLENQIIEENLAEKEWGWRQHHREHQAAIIVWLQQWAHPATREGVGND